MGRPWTTKKAERVWKRLRGGVNVNTIAADMGCTVTNIHKRLRTAGYSPNSGRRTDVDANAKLILERRKAGVEFGDIAVELGMEPSRMVTRCLYMRLVRYCEREEIPYPHATRQRKHQGNRNIPAVTPMMVTDAIIAVKKRVKRGEQTDVMDLSDALHVPDRLAKRIVAEMRRRRLAADGLVPTKVDADPKLTGCERAVMDAARAAWADEKRPCETLTTLASTGYARATLNIAIVNLRNLGLLEPRGFIYLRV